MPALKVLIAEKQHMIRGAFVALLEAEPDLSVVASVDRGDLVIPAARECRPDVAVLDLETPNIDGLTAAKLLHGSLPSCRTIILAGLARPGVLRRALSAPAVGFLLKTAPAERLPEAVREVASGHRIMDPHLVVAALNAGESPLSSRESQVLMYVAQGAEPNEIASALQLSVGTIRNYLTTVVTKLNARNKVDAVRIATETGWIPSTWIPRP
ncbi:response regulator transcription factor [Actinomadura rupiterrae]|uniref:response regulator transcription factor n=1 Tax=Actinomadura rupiterrae TaxID=559627 RepID=UPI0020A61054|nr:response regulator transcription factor [Actinomadura rupiterrae]MCP2339280.1 two-component system response regulator DesR [Actinomadura rupiterrae]